jgi:A/G-specific adenine glycosylase
MAALRAASDPIDKAELDLAWPDDPVQRERALDSLVADGLVEPVTAGCYRLPMMPDNEKP